jgi:hypothetical protein
MTRGLGPTRHASWPGTEEAKPQRVERVTAPRLQALLHLRLNQRVKGRTAMQVACNCTTGMHPFDFNASNMEAQAHTSCNRRAGYYVRKLHRHLRQYRAFSTAEPVPRLEATLRMAQQCQPSTSVTGQSAAGEGATVEMAKSGPAVMATAGGRKQQSNRLQAHVPSCSSRGALSHGVKTTHPCSVPRTARATQRLPREPPVPSH